MILLGLALAADLPADDDNRNCAAKAEEAAAATATLADLAKKMHTEPVSGKALKKRIQAVESLGDRGLVCTVEARRDAGVVLVTSRKDDTLQRAYRYAESAIPKRLDRALWIATAAYDRRSLANGQGQTFGTQTGRRKGANEGCLYPFEPKATDEHRKSWQQPSLTETLRTFLDERGRTTEPAELKTLARLNLLCDIEDF